MVTEIDSKWLANKNPKAGLSPMEHFIDYTNNNGGYHPALRAIHDTVRLGNTISNGTFPHLEAKLGATVGVLPLLTIPSATVSTLKSFSDLTYETGVDFSRKAMNAIRLTADCISAFSWSATLFTSNPSVKTTAEIMDLTASTVGLQTTAANYHKALELESLATGDAKAALAHSKNYYFLAMAKNIASVAIGIFGLIMLITGFQILSALALIALSLAATTFEMMRDVQKQTGPYPLIDFDREVRLEVL